MSAKDKVSEILDKLKSENKKVQITKPKIFFKDISDMNFSQNPRFFGNNFSNQSSDPENPLIKRIEILIRRIDDIKHKMEVGSNYLMLYAELKRLESEFLESAEEIRKDKLTISPNLSNRIQYKKHEILKKRNG